jgi:hypothetical protein
MFVLSLFFATLFLLLNVTGIVSEAQIEVGLLMA